MRNLALVALVFVSTASHAADFTSPNGFFVFSQAKFSATFPLDPKPMKVDISASDAKTDRVKFSAENGMYTYLFDVVAGTADANDNLDVVLETAKKTARSAELIGQCPFGSPKNPCLYIQDIVYNKELPVYVTANIVFQSQGRVYYVTAANFAPSANIRSKAELKDFHPDGSLSMAKLALKTFMTAVRTQ